VDNGDLLNECQVDAVGSDAVVGNGGSEEKLSPIEYSECVLYDAVRQVASLCVDAMHVPVPQMWIGSSLAVACEADKVPTRQRAMQLLSASPATTTAAPSPCGLARVKIFDWGRSELKLYAAKDFLATQRFEDDTTVSKEGAPLTRRLRRAKPRGAGGAAHKRGGV